MEGKSLASQQLRVRRLLCLHWLTSKVSQNTTHVETHETSRVGSKNELPDDDKLTAAERRLETDAGRSLRRHH